MSKPAAPAPVPAREPGWRVLDSEGHEVTGARAPPAPPPNGIQMGTILIYPGNAEAQMFVDAGLFWSGSEWKTGYTVVSLSLEDTTDERVAEARRKYLKMFGWLR